MEERHNMPNFPGLAFNNPSSAFISSWKTDNTSGGSSTDHQVALPLQSNGTYNFIVMWGDGNSDTITTWNQAQVTHTYASIGTYTVTITGVCTGWAFGGGGDKLKILNISSFGPLKLGNNTNYFAFCNNLTITATDSLNLSGTTDISGAFNACTSLTTVPSMNSWDFSGVLNMTNMLRNCSSFNQAIGNWNVSSVTTMAGLFVGCTVFNQPIGSWNMTAVTDIGLMFSNAIAFNQDISTWVFSVLTAMNNTFNGATAFNQPIGSWNTAGVTTMIGALQNATAFNQDLSGWNVTSLTNGANFLSGVTLTNANYNALLISWGAQSVQSGVVFSGGNSHYNGASAIAARATLTVTKTWTITDGGTP